MTDSKRKILTLSRKAEAAAEKQDIPAVCLTCRFNFADGERSECRRNPPSKGGFPKVTPETWCGQYKVTLKVLELPSASP